MKRTFDDVAKEESIKERNKDESTKSVKDHYNQIENCGVETRNQSKIICMRNFNNWLKSMIINEFVNLAKENCHANPSNIKVLDIGCGKGGDLKKYSACGIQHLVCTDIADISLQHCTERYEKMKNEKINNRNFNYNRSPLFTCEIIPADSTKDTLHEKLKNPNILFDLTMIQFAYHYSFQSIEQATKMLENASRNLREGGYLVGTTVNSNKVMSKTLNQKKLEVGNDIYSIKFPNKALEYDKVPLFGNEYIFNLHECVTDCPEYLVHFPTVVHIAKKFNLELHYQKRFEDYYLEKLNDDDHNGNRNQNRKLLERMRSLKPFPLDESDRQDLNDEQIADEYEEANNLLMNDSNIQINNVKRIGTISKSEWEAITLYIVFAFKKITPKK